MKNKSEKLAEARALLAGKEPDEFKVIWWNSDSGEPKPPAPALGKGLLVIINNNRIATLEKIIQEGREMETKKANKPLEPETTPDNTPEPEQLKPDPIPEDALAPEPEQLKPDPIPEDALAPEPTTTLFNQPTEVDFYIQRRAQAKRKTHF